MKTKSPKGSLAPRNVFVTGVMLRGGAGAHGKTKKAQRRDDKVALKRKAQEVHQVNDTDVDAVSPLSPYSEEDNVSPAKSFLFP